MLTRSKQRLLSNNENINKENSLSSLKRKRSTTKTKTQINKENVVPSSIGYSLRSKTKPKENVLLLKSKNENVLNNERKVLKEKSIKSHNNIINKLMDKPFKANILKDHNNVINNKIAKPLKEKTTVEKRETKIFTNNSNNKTDGKRVDPKMVVLIEGNKLQKDLLKKIETQNDTTDIEQNSKRIKIEKKDDNKSQLKEKINNKQNSSVSLQDENKDKKNDQNSLKSKPSILKKSNNSAVTKRREKVTFDDKVKNISNSLIIPDSFSSDSHLIDKTITNNDKNEKIKIDDLSPIKKQSNASDIIVPFIRLDSLESDKSITSISSNSSNDDNKLSRKSSNLSDKSLELLTEFNKGGGKVQISDILESLNCKSHFKSSTPNGFNRTLLFLEESPINYTRILNEEMSVHTPLSSSVKSPEKEVSSISQNTSFQDSNSISNFINISPISNSHIHRTDSDFSHLDIQPEELIDESDLFNTDDKSLLYSMDELDEKIKELLSGNDNFNLVSDDENKNILRYKPLPAEKLNEKSKNKNNKLIPAMSNHDFITSSSRVYPTRNETPVVEELTYDQPEDINFSQGSSSSDDPFGFSKAEKIYKTKQQQIKSGAPHTPVHTPRYYAAKKESHSLDNANEILLQEHQQIIETRKKNRNRKKIKVEDMEELVNIYINNMNSIYKYKYIFILKIIYYFKFIYKYIIIIIFFFFVL